MYLNDPDDLARPPTLEASDIDFEEEPADPRDKFWEEAGYYPDSIGYYQGIHVGVCHFDYNGNHTIMAKNCPHYDAVDEQGPVIRQGWTVQGR